MNYQTSLLLGFFTSQNITGLDNEGSQKSLYFSSRFTSSLAKPRKPQCFLYILTVLSTVKTQFSATKHLATEKQRHLLTPMIQT